MTDLADTIEEAREQLGQAQIYAQQGSDERARESIQACLAALDRIVEQDLQPIMTDGGQLQEPADLPHVAGPDEVDRPDWAQAYDVGDEIVVQVNGLSLTAPVVGFSTILAWRGLPVIEPAGELAEAVDDHTTSLAVEQQYVVEQEVDE